MSLHETSMPELPSYAVLVPRNHEEPVRYAYLIDDLTTLQDNGIAQCWDSAFFPAVAYSANVQPPDKVSVFIVLPEVPFADIKQQLFEALQDAGEHAHIGSTVQHFSKTVSDSQADARRHSEQVPVASEPLLLMKVVVFSKDFFEGYEHLQDAWAGVYSLMGTTNTTETYTTDIRATLATGTWHHHRAFAYDALAIVSKVGKGQVFFEVFDVYNAHRRDEAEPQ